MERGWTFCWVHDGIGILTIAEDPLPHFEVHEKPKPIAVIGAGLMLLNERTNAVWIEDLSSSGAFAQHELLHNGLKVAAQPAANRHGKSHFSASQNLDRQQIANGFTKHRLAGEATHFQSRRKRSHILDQLIVEERHAAFDRRRHAHLILLHQKLV